MNGTLAILGASSRAAAQSATRAGIEAYAIDLFADQDLAVLCPAERIVRYPADFFSAIERVPNGPWIYTGGLENYPRLIERLAKKRRLWGNRGKALVRVRDPRELARAFAAAGFSFPASQFEVMATEPSGEWLLKRRRSSGGQSVRMIDARGISRLRGGEYLQQFIAGSPASAVFVMAGGRSVLLGSSRQIVARDWGLEPPFQYVGSVAPYEMDEPRLELLRSIGELVAAEFDLVGLVGIDFIDDGERLWPIEVNPRYTASVEVLERLLGAHFVAFHAEACERGTLPASPPKPQSGYYCGKAVVYAQRSYVAGGRFHELVRNENEDERWPRIADIPRCGQPIECGSPIVTVFADAVSLAEVDADLRRLAAEVIRSMDHESNESNE